MKKVLVATDFSDRSMNALAYADSLKGYYNLEILVLHVDKEDREEVTMEVGQMERIMSAIYEDPRRSNTLTLPEYMTFKRTKNLNIVDGIVLEAEKNDVDLIIIGARGESDPSYEPLGSVSYGVIQSTTRNVLVVPQEAHFKVPENILYATNYYKEDNRAMEVLAQFARTFSSSIHCVHIDVDHEFTRWDPDRAERFSNLAADLDITFTNVYSQSILEGFDYSIEKEKIDFIAMLVNKKPQPADPGKDLINAIAHHSRKTPLLVLNE